MTHGVLAPQRSTFTSRKTVNGSRGDVTPWVRPADWLALTTPSPSDQRMVGLAAVFQSNSNFVTVRSSAAFKVDWGDGAGWNLYAANTTAEKNLQWADYDAGTLTTWGYRQAVVQVEPQSGNLTGLELQWRHSNAATSANTSSVWLDLRIACTGTPVLTGSGPGWNHAMVETVEITSPITSGYYLFRNCFSLRNVGALNTTGASNLGAMFYNCYSLQQVPTLDTSSGTNFVNMFYNCSSLQQVPALDTSSGTNFTDMFQNCFSLQQVPTLDTSSGTNFASMFQYCYSLQSVPTLDTSSGTNFTSMFYNCYSLQQVPALNTSAGTNFTSMFQNCYSLQGSDVYGGKYAISYATANLSAAALDNIYTNLGTASGAQTITVTSNWGTSGDDPSIATAKGWTVAGS